MAKVCKRELFSELILNVLGLILTSQDKTGVKILADLTASLVYRGEDIADCEVARVCQSTKLALRSELEKCKRKIEFKEESAVGEVRERIRDIRAWVAGEKEKFLSLTPGSPEYNDALVRFSLMLEVLDLLQNITSQANFTRERLESFYRILILLLEKIKDLNMKELMMARGYLLSYFILSEGDRLFAFE